MKHFFFPSDCICFLNIVFPYISWRQNKRLKIRALIFFFSHLLSCWQFSDTSPLGRINRSGLCTPQHFAQTVNTTLTTLCYCQVFFCFFPWKDHEQLEDLLFTLSPRAPKRLPCSRKALSNCWVHLSWPRRKEMQSASFNRHPSIRRGLELHFGKLTNYFSRSHKF